jgi:hypothetical protein
MPDPQELRIHDIQRRATALGTDVAHILAADTLRPSGRRA